MPKTHKPRFYAVCVGRDGPAIYKDWKDCYAQTYRFPYAKHRRFGTYDKAKAWLIAQVQVPILVARRKRVRRGRRRTKKNLHNQHGQLSTCLSNQQQDILRMVKDGKNVFFTGCAGTGKSVLLGEIIRHLRNESKNVAVTATTGIAAVNIGGCTIHSWAGIGLGKDEAEKYIGRFLWSDKYALVLNRWQGVDTLVIDEISLLDGALFDKLEFIARRVRQSAEPFGGIQLVLAGDFFQLPPIGDLASFAFEAKTWKCVGSPAVLTEVFRQRDEQFIRMLNEVRYGEMSQTTVEKFKSLHRSVVYSDGIEPTELFPRRDQVRAANETKLSKLPGKAHIYHAIDVPGIDGDGNPVSQEQTVNLLDRLNAPESLMLKVGAQVMLIKNLEQGILVNGSVGVVESFFSDEHDREPSRGEWPVVRFTNGRVHVCRPTEFSIESPLGQIEARRTQVPLILAWALSIHKSQGQSLTRVKVDLDRVFERGQAYVALSRATNMDTLQVLSFKPRTILAHPTVLSWHRSQTVDEEWGDEDFKDLYFKLVDEKL